MEISREALDLSPSFVPWRNQPRSAGIVLDHILPRKSAAQRRDFFWTLFYPENQPRSTGTFLDPWHSPVPNNPPSETEHFLRPPQEALEKWPGTGKIGENDGAAGAAGGKWSGNWAKCSAAGAGMPSTHL